MIKIAPLCLLFLIIQYNLCFAQTYKKSEIQKDTLITLLKDNNFQKKVVLIQNNEFQVETSLQFLKENIENWLLKYPHLKQDKQLLEIIIGEFKDKNVVDAEKIANKHNLASRLSYRIAGLLQEGKCVIINQDAKKVIDVLKLQSYNIYCGPLCGSGGRRFYLNDFLIFEVMDWIS